MKEIKIYDYNSKSTTIELPIGSVEEIESIMVIVLTGDENVCIQLKNGKTIQKDASNCRNADYIDGGYMLKSKSSIEKWINFIPKDEYDALNDYLTATKKNFYTGEEFGASYQRLREFAPGQFGSHGIYERFDPKCTYDFYIEEKKNEHFSI